MPSTDAAMLKEISTLVWNPLCESKAHADALTGGVKTGIVIVALVGWIFVGLHSELEMKRNIVFFGPRSAEGPTQSPPKVDPRSAQRRPKVDLMSTHGQGQPKHDPGSTKIRPSLGRHKVAPMSTQ